MSRPALRAVGAGGREEDRVGGRGWLDWLRAHVDPAWRAGEWDPAAMLFTGDLASVRTAAWPCRTAGCPTATRRHYGRCDSCRRARSAVGVSWANFDAEPRR